MGKKCCVPKCRSGYAPIKAELEIDYEKEQEQKNNKSVSVFSFPDDKDILQKWIRAIPRDNWKPTINSGVCELHFEPDAIVVERADSNKRREKKKNHLKLRRLKSDAVPTIFEGCPSYLSKRAPKRRSGGATSNGRTEKIKAYEREQTIIFDEADKIESINDIVAKLDRSLLPVGVLENKTRNKLIFFEANFDIKPTFLSCLCINEDLTFTAWRNDVKLPANKFAHVTRSHRIQRCSHLVDIINICVQDSDFTTQATDTIAYCSDKLKTILEDLDENLKCKTAFLIEQLCLISKGSYSRRYSPDLIASASSWLLNSPSLYNQLRLEVLSLPTPHYVKRLTQALNVDFGLSKTTEIYLKTRFDHLPNEREKIVSIILDEVYAASNVEFVGGKFFGCENGAPTKTLLCSMIKSVAGRYHDIVTLTPLTCINSGIIFKVYMTLLESVVKIGFDVTVTLVDGHSSNCKFFKDELCSGMLNCSINNPLQSQNRIFLLFDPVHIFKNFYNNLINKKVFECPNFENEIIKPNFEHISEIYNIELGKSVKIAHRLSDKVLAPASIEKN